MDDNVFARLMSLRDEDGADGSAAPLFRGSVYHIGRDVRCQVKVADPTVLHFHCCIDYVELVGPRITPAVGSKIIVNGNESEKPVLLQDGDIIRLGNKRLRIDVRRILPTRTDDGDREEQPLPKPLLVDTITPPRVTKMTVRPKTQCKSLLSSTKPPVVAVSKRAGDSPAKRQLFSDDDDENKKPVRLTRKTKAASSAEKKDQQEPVTQTEAEAEKPAPKRGRKGSKNTNKKQESTSESGSKDDAPVVRRSTRMASATRNQALVETVTRKTVRFASRSKK